MLKRALRAAVVAGLACAGLLVPVTAASAAQAPAAAAAPQPRVVGVRLPGTAGQTVSANCFNRVGNFRGGTQILVVDWDANGSSDECFGIAPNRAIYHAWPRSDGWDPMPNNGRADDTVGADITSGGYRRVVVHVNGKGDYYTILVGNWRPWAPF